MASHVEKDQLELFITKMSKAARSNKIFLDYLRNDRGSTAAAAYSPRARADVPVALPLSWKELDERIAPKFTVAGFAQWKARLRHDPWKTMNGLNQALTRKVLDGAGVKD